MRLAAALAYARHGIPVLPVHTALGGDCSCGRRGCDRPGKHPRLRHGLTEATTDPLCLETWWTRWPDANIGLRSGIVMDVADIDSTEGWHGLRRLLRGAMPVGPRVRTGGGGWHVWFHPTGYGNRVRLLPAVDWRGAGGYVLAPPSRHASGADYTWLIKPSGDLPRVPHALAELIEGPPPAGPTRAADSSAPMWVRSARSSTGWASPPPAVAHPDRYSAAALEAEADRVARAPVGTRNDTLNRAAFSLGRLVAAGMLDAWTVRSTLDRAARCAGLGRAEIRRTIRSGLTAGQAHPFSRDLGVVVGAKQD